MAYTASDTEKKYRQLGSEAETSIKLPTTTTSQTQNVQNTADKITNFGDFSYDPTSDALYQQYAKQYTALGKQAMADTMGKAAAKTGGYGNSYAATAGQQTYNQYMGALADKIPELYQLAYSMHNDKLNNLYKQLDMYTTLDSTEYGRNQDLFSNSVNLADYYNGRADADRTFYYGVHRDEVGDEQWAKSYGLEQDQLDFTKNQAGISNAREDASMIAQGFTKNADGSWDYNGTGNSVDPLSAKDMDNLISLSEAAADRGEDSLMGLLHIFVENGIIDENDVNAISEYYFPSIEAPPGGYANDPNWRDTYRKNMSDLLRAANQKKK